MKREDINLDVDYEELAYLEGCIMHDVKRLGEAGCVQAYIEKVDSIEVGNDVSYNFIRAFIKYFANKNGIEYQPVYKETKGWVLDYEDGLLLDDYTEEEVSSISIETGVKEFRDCGILKYNIDEAI